MIVENERYVLGELLESPFVTPLRFCFETKNHFAFAIECTIVSIKSAQEGSCSIS